MLGVACGRIGYDPLDGDADPDTDPDADPDSAVDADGDAPDTGPDPLLVGCVVYEHMDEAAWTGVPGEVDDACGGDDLGTAVGGATTVSNGVRGRAGSFPGGAGCVNVPASAALHANGALTLSAWVFPTALNGVTEYGVLSKRTNFGQDTEYSVFVWTSDNVYVDVDTENDREPGGNVALVNDTWQQLTVTYDGALAGAERVHIYVNGALDLTKAETSATVPLSGAGLSVGCLPLGGPAQGWVGKLDEVVVWNRALSSAEVAAWYQQTRP